MSIHVSLNRLLLLIWGLVAFVLVLGATRQVAVAMTGAGTHAFGYDVFSLDAEANLPAAISSLLLFGASLVLYLKSRMARASGDRDARNWTLLALGFTYLSVDEVAQLHEKFKGPLRAMATWTDFLAFPWIVVAIPAVIAVGIYFLPFLMRMAPGLRLRCLFSGAVYLTGAIGMEMVNGRLATSFGLDSGIYALSITLEEGLEFIGVALFLTFMLRHLALDGRAARLTLG